MTINYPWLEEQIKSGLIFYNINDESYYTKAFNTITQKEDKIILHPNDQNILKQLRSENKLKIKHIGMTNQCVVKIKE